jgi:hypothetical protein
LDGRRYKVNAVIEGDNVDVFGEVSGNLLLYEILLVRRS